MQGEQSGIQGATPQLQVQAVDPTLPRCGRPLFDGAERATCTRTQGHYGRCGRPLGDGTIATAGGR